MGRIGRTREEIAAMQASLDAHDQTRERLRQAGQRAKDADIMRRAAIAEMGQAIRDNRARQQELGTTNRIDMDDAAALTGFSRRTLSAAVGTDYPGDLNLHVAGWGELSDRDLAIVVRDGADDGYGAEEELRQRHPVLAGLDLAAATVMREATRRWREEHPDVNLLDEPDDLGQVAAWHDIRRAYREIVGALANDRPAPVVPLNRSV
ncbi:hypothetical protein [Streptomyces acidiscabies]|uniref:Uncharacterized protein n=1 Tax=Streptomyces acidiscabies TaxID=42234 RepID=A0ABU4MCM1_9ACTN|nr:hypothetical protein [Streptomyces acidiscabies]MDX3025653.1 hypothetical protein [Streptomyces acidiscabies]